MIQTVDLMTRRVYSPEGEITLRLKEFELLKYLVRNRHRAVPHEDIRNAVWGQGDLPGGSYKVQMANLGRRIGREHLRSLRGWGYQFEGDVEVIEGED